MPTLGSSSTPTWFEFDMLPPRVPLDALPAELLLDICKLVRTPKRVPQLPSRHPKNIETVREIDVSRNTAAAQSDLLAFSLTCRRLLSIAQPLLYAHPVTIGDEAKRRFELLCTTLRKYRDLVLFVKSIQLSATAVSGDGLGSTDGDAALLPNLKSVYMWIPSTFDEDEDDETTAREALKQPAYVPFPCHSLLLRGQYDKAYIDVSSGLFLDESGWLSKVQTLDLRAVDFTWSRGTLPRNRLGSLRTLRLWHSGMHVLNYKWLLRSMGHPPLSTVSICISDITEEEHRAYATAPPAGTPLYPLPVHLAVQALLPWATTLRCLTHVVTGHTPWPDRHWDLSKLTAFVALEFLWLESAYFYFNPSKTALTDILPPNLVTLRLSGVSLPAAALAHLRDAIVEEAKFLALARVTIDEQGFDLADANEKAVVQSLSLLHDAGIRVTALPQPLPGYEEPADEDDD